MKQIKEIDVIFKEELLNELGYDYVDITEAGFKNRLEEGCKVDYFRSTGFGNGSKHIVLTVLYKD